MFSSPTSTDLILVAFLPSPRDLQIARVLGWYRIPARTAPRVLSVDYLAFYQPASFGDSHKWRVEYLAPVRGHELTTRLELLTEEPDHPRAREEYYKIQLGPLQPLRHPIHAGDWKRFTFLYTTGEYLHQAETLNDLTVRSAERSTLWKALRERADSAQEYQPETPDVDLNPAVLAALLGIREGSEGYEGYEGNEGSEGYEEYEGSEGYEGNEGSEGYEEYEESEGYEEYEESEDREGSEVSTEGDDHEW